MKYALLLAAVLGLLLCGCRRSSQAEFVPKQTVESSVKTPETTPEETEDQPAVGEKAQLLCQAENQAQAREIAALYGIELVDWHDGLATFRTEEDPREVIQRGEEQGWPSLSLNQSLKLH